MVAENLLLLVLGDVSLLTSGPCSGKTQEFMAFMTTTGLSEVIFRPIYMGGYNLDLVFALEKILYYLEMERLFIILLL